MAAQKQSTDSSVFALISSFTSGLDVFRKLREKRGKKKRKQQEELTALEEEARLSQSLARGPVDIQTEYENNYAVHGERFRDGDAHAHASLAAVLLKLNNGLVSIISSFLGNGKKGSKLDYDSLTILSETSRFEAIDALSKLSYRLSHSRLSNLLRPSSKKLDRDDDGRTAKKKSSRRKQTPTRISAKPVPIKQIQSSNVSTPRLAMLRPRPAPKRTASSGSASGKHGHSSNRSSHSRTRSHTRSQSQTMFPPPTFASPPRMPTPPRMQSPPLSPPPQQREHHRRSSTGIKSRLAKSTPNLLSRPPRHSTPAGQAFPAPPASPYAPSFAPSQLLSPNLPPGPSLSLAATDFTYVPPASSSIPRRRRTQKSVASIQTFSSGSTKLGEIPHHKWVQPLDFAEMARLNASAALLGAPVGQQGEAVAVGKAKKGFWGGLFGKKKRGDSNVVVG